MFPWSLDLSFKFSELSNPYLLFSLPHLPSTPQLDTIWLLQHAPSKTFLSAKSSDFSNPTYIYQNNLMLPPGWSPKSPQDIFKDSNSSAPTQNFLLSHPAFCIFIFKDIFVSLTFSPGNSNMQSGLGTTELHHLWNASRIPFHVCILYWFHQYLKVFSQPHILHNEYILKHT